MNEKKPKVVFVPPTFSWDIPIEEEILSFVRQMANNMELTSRQNVWGKIRKGAESYAAAYRTVEKHIVKELALRQEIKKLRETPHD